MVVVGWVDDQGGVAGVPVGESYGVVVGASGDAKTGYVSAMVIGSAFMCLKFLLELILLSIR